MRDLNNPVQKEIHEAVQSNPIILFMKGTPDFPQCGFSARTAQILNSYGIKYAAVNVLAHPEVREEIKAYADWPTIPQLYISGEFIGGCDIVTEMQAKGELAPLIQAAKAPKDV